MCSSVPRHSSLGCLVNIYTKDVLLLFCLLLFFRFDLKSSVSSHVFRSLFKNEGQKRAGSWDMFYTFATHSGLVLDVIDTVCSQNGSNHDFVSATLKCRFSLNRARNRVDFKKLTFGCIFCVPFLSIESVVPLHTGFPLSVQPRD